MIKNKTVFEIEKNDKLFQFHVDPTSTLGEVHDVLLEMHKFVVDRINEAHKSMKPVDAEEKEEVPKEFTE